MRLPSGLLRHRITVEPYLGEGGAKPLYGPPVVLRCHLEPMRTSARRGDDRASDERTRCIVALTDGPRLQLDSRVTVAGRVVEVLSRHEHTYPGGGLPEHVEVMLR